MLTIEEAMVKVVEYLRQRPISARHELKIQTELTREEDFGWVFFYNTKRYLEDGDADSALGGNAPLIVDKHTSSVVPTGTAFPIQHYIDYYKKHGNLSGVHLVLE